MIALQRPEYFSTETLCIDVVLWNYLVWSAEQFFSVYYRPMMSANLWACTIGFHDSPASDRTDYFLEGSGQCRTWRVLRREKRRHCNEIGKKCMLHGRERIFSECYFASYIFGENRALPTLVAQYTFFDSPEHTLRPTTETFALKSSATC